jgi:hypothetical protein
VKIVHVHKEIECHHYESAADQSERQIASGILHLACEKRDVVPTIVSPKRTDHRCGKSRNTAADDVYAFTSSAVIDETKISPIAIAVEERAQTDTNQQHDLHSSEHARDATADSYRGAVDQCGDNDCQEGDELQSCK